MATSTVNAADIEKGPEQHPISTKDNERSTLRDDAPPVGSQDKPRESGLSICTRLKAISKRIESLSGLEARGIRRVEAFEKTSETTLSGIGIVLLWISINLAAQNIALGIIGPTVYELGFVDASLCAVFGGIVGSIPVAYTATWGPISGNRTLVRTCA
jgi:hypothetical protein